jgi:hypothetical protein
MSYPVNYKGVTVNVESLDEVADLIRKITAEETPVTRVREPMVVVAPENPVVEVAARVENQTLSPLTPQRIAQFWKSLGAPERQLLKTLAQVTRELGTNELASGAKVDTKDLKYSLKRIHSRAKKAHIKGTLLIDSKPDYSHRPVKSKYTMSEEARQMILPLIAAPT